MCLPEDFDWKFYLEYYPDLQNSGLKNELDAVWHYTNFGFKENRIYVNKPILYEDLTFIHIPKCGGTSISNFLKSLNLKRKIVAENYNITTHSPNHLTYQELEELNLLSDNIFTIIRSNIDRTISEYFYIQKYRQDLSSLFNNFDEFLNLFLDKNNTSLFDFHNLSNKEFLIDKSGKVNTDIKIFNYFDIYSIERYLGITGLNQFHKLKTEKNDFQLSGIQLNKIKTFFGDDLI